MIVVVISTLSEDATAMATSQCHSCNKAVPFVDRMMYCSFCGTKLHDLEIHNAGQRKKQEGVVATWKILYVFGGLLVLIFIVVPFLKHFVSTGAITEVVYGRIVIASFVVWFGCAFTNPFAKWHAKKRHPEKAE